MAEKIAQLHIGNVNGHVLSDDSGRHLHLLPQTYKVGISKKSPDSADSLLGEAVWNLGPMYLR
jgi:hypothetical protein